MDSTLRTKPDLMEGAPCLSLVVGLIVCACHPATHDDAESEIASRIHQSDYFNDATTVP